MGQDQVEIVLEIREMKWCRGLKKTARVHKKRLRQWSFKLIHVGTLRCLERMECYHYWKNVLLPKSVTALFSRMTLSNQLPLRIVKRRSHFYGAPWTNTHAPGVPNCMMTQILSVHSGHISDVLHHKGYHHGCSGAVLHFIAVSLSSYVATKLLHPLPFPQRQGHSLFSHAITAAKPQRPLESCLRPEQTVVWQCIID